MHISDEFPSSWDCHPSLYYQNHLPKIILEIVQIQQSLLIPNTLCWTGMFETRQCQLDLSLHYLFYILTADIRWFPFWLSGVLLPACYYSSPNLHFPVWNLLAFVLAIGHLSVNSSYLHNYKTILVWKSPSV